MKKIHPVSVTLIGFAALTLAANAIPSPTLSWTATDARYSPGALNNWRPEVNTTGKPMHWNTISNTPSPVLVTGSSNFGSINDWVSKPSYRLNTNNTNDSWQDQLGHGATRQDASWEMVFRPGDFTGKHTLFNTGGNGDGTAIVLIDDEIEFRFQDANNNAQRIKLSLDLIGSADEFYHIVGIADMDPSNVTSPATGHFYVNGTLVGSDTSSGTLYDWDGGDLAELGWGNNIPGDNPFNPDPFTGDIAFFNYYRNVVLTDSEVAELKRAVPDGGSAALLLGASLLGLGAIRKKNSRR